MPFFTACLKQEPNGSTSLICDTLSICSHLVRMSPSHTDMLMQMFRGPKRKTTCVSAWPLSAWSLLGVGVVIVWCWGGHCRVLGWSQSGVGVVAVRCWGGHCRVLGWSLSGVWANSPTVAPLSILPLSQLEYKFKMDSAELTGS